MVLGAAILFVLTNVALAEEAKTDAQWLKELRGSGTYRQGMAYVERVVEAAYDIGAIAGASHWEDVHAYYTRLARSKGCTRGSRSDGERVRACPRVSSVEPSLLGADYRDGKREVDKLALQTSYPDLLQRVLAVLYEYGYVQGMKHGMRVHDEDIRLRQTYYRACVERAQDAALEPVCAEASKAWARRLLARLNERIEAHGIPDGDKP